MNIYLADQVAREHADRMMADAALARRVRQVRASRRVAGRPAADLAETRPAHRVGHLVTRPYRALHTWLAAGLL
jgi:hypothetical protein